MQYDYATRWHSNHCSGGGINSLDALDIRNLYYDLQKDFCYLHSFFFFFVVVFFAPNEQKLCLGLN